MRTVASDVELLRNAFTRDAPGDTTDAVRPATALGRVLLALDARRRADAGPIAIVPCDNLPDNGGLLGRALADLAGRTSPDLAAWLAASVSVVSTSIDRITPAIDAEAESHAVLEATGWLDAAPVVTEPFSDWVLEGDFPAGRPDWESAGARFVDEIAPWENRKLWMLNGAHTVLATFGQTRGHTVVSAAIEDPVCRDLVEALWDDAARSFPASTSPTTAPRSSNASATPASSTVSRRSRRTRPPRCGCASCPSRSADSRRGHEAPGCAAAIAAWMLGVRAGWAPPPDGIDQPAIADLDASARHALLAALNARLADDAGFAAHVADAVTALEAS